jgi:tRNA pseudouridine55 synthase
MNTAVSEQSYIDTDVILVHKPLGDSSFDVIRKLRKLLSTRKMGHAGTLDPLVHGLMIVGVDSGTKKMDQYLKLPKTYIADIFLGKATTTADLEGEIIAQKKIEKKDIRAADVEEVLLGMKGTQNLMVPLFSAIKVDGKKLYEYARKYTCPIEIPVKPMEVISVHLLDYYSRDNGMVVRVRFEVGSGTYIRTLAEELGRRLDVPAVLVSLYRTRIAKYRDEDAFRYE